MAGTFTVMLLAWVSADPKSADGAAPTCRKRELGARTNAMLVYHPVERRILLFGGRSSDSSDSYPSSLWAWDGRQWRCVAADGPPGRMDGEMVFDAHRNRVVLYGGRSTRLVRDTWEWDGARWTLADSVGPAPRIHMVLGYDPARRAVLMHGGLGRPGPDQFLRDSWAWDGRSWRPVAITSDTTGGDHHNALMTAGDRVLLMDAAPDASSNCVSDTLYQRARMRLFELRGSAWVSLDSPGPCISGSAPSVWTPGGILLYAGWDASDPQKPAEFWSWREGAWQRIRSAPPRRRGARIAYDAARGRAVLFGGDTDAGILGDTWEWDGERWHDVRPPTRRPPAAGL